jgi:hypothetical protein
MAAASYCFTLTAATVVSAFQCRRWPSPAEVLIGESELDTTLFWAHDWDVMCYEGQHAVLVAVAVVVGMPWMLLYLLLLGAACYSCIIAEKDVAMYSSRTAAPTKAMPVPGGTALGVQTPGVIAQPGQNGDRQQAKSTLPREAGRPTLHCKLLGFLSKEIPWELLLVGLSWRGCWWVALREVGKLVLGIGVECLSSRSAGTQAAVVMGMVGALAVAQALFQPWTSVWVRRGAELSYTGLVWMSLLLCGLVVGGAGFHGVDLGMAIGVLVVTALVTTVLIARIVRRSTCHCSTSQQQGCAK